MKYLLLLILPFLISAGWVSNSGFVDLQNDNPYTVHKNEGRCVAKTSESCLSIDVDPVLSVIVAKKAAIDADVSGRETKEVTRKANMRTCVDKIKDDTITNAQMKTCIGHLIKQVMKHEFTLQEL